MRLQAKKRDSGQWDIYVLNDVNPGSAYHAGGMPKVWLVYHCITAEAVRKAFPDVTVANNEPAKDVKIVSRSEPAPKQLDTEIKLQVSQKELEASMTSAPAPKKTTPSEPSQKATTLAVPASRVETPTKS
jgi:hypothetical protein